MACTFIIKLISTYFSCLLSYVKGTFLQVVPNWLLAMYVWKLRLFVFPLHAPHFWAFLLMLKIFSWILDFWVTIIQSANYGNCVFSIAALLMSGSYALAPSFKWMLISTDNSWYSWPWFNKIASKGLGFKYYVRSWLKKDIFITWREFFFFLRNWCEFYQIS